MPAASTEEPAAMAGPLPDPKARRRNAPTIPTTVLPAGGFPGPYPKVPAGSNLGKAGAAWWRWAWRTPQAAAWSPGDVYAVARRARLEDDLAALEVIDNLDLIDLLAEEDVARTLEDALRKLKAIAGGKMAIVREARELDDRFGLTPKAMASLRWTIRDEAPAPAAGTDNEDDEIARRRRERHERGVGT